jgi:hypothetical protein
VRDPELPIFDCRYCRSSIEPFFTGFLGAVSSHLKQGICFQHVLDAAHGAEPPYRSKFAELVRPEMPGIRTARCGGCRTDA